MDSERGFLCPSCGAELNRQRPDFIGLDATVRGPAFAVTFPIAIPAALGVYGAEHDPRVVLEAGCRVDFSCPQCGKDFTSSYSSDWAELKMVEEGRQYVVVFNKVHGEHASFLFDFATRRLVGTYGDATADYVEQFGKDLNFFGS